MNIGQKSKMKSQFTDRPKIISPERFVLENILKSKWKHRVNGCTETYDTRKYRTKK